MSRELYQKPQVIILSDPSDERIIELCDRFVAELQENDIVVEIGDTPGRPHA